MSLLLYLVMIISAIGMIIGVMKDKQGYTWGRPLALVCIIVILLMAVTIIRPDRSAQRVARSRRDQGHQIVGEIIGRKLAEDFSGGHALVIDIGKQSEHYKKGLEKGVKGQVSLETIEPSRDMLMRAITGQQNVEETEMVIDELMSDYPIEIFFRARMMDELIDSAVQDPDVIVSFIGLPSDFENMRLWRQRNHPPIVITSEMGMMGIRKIADYISRGSIAAMVMRKPETSFDEESIPRDVNEAFDSHYIMVTPDNIQEMSSRYPDRFMEGF